MPNKTEIEIPEAAKAEAIVRLHLPEGHDYGKHSIAARFIEAFIDGATWAADHLKSLPDQPPHEEVFRKAIVLRDAYNSYVKTLSNELFVLRGGKDKGIDHFKAQESSRDSLHEALKPFVGMPYEWPDQTKETGLRYTFEQVRAIAKAVYKTFSCLPSEFDKCFDEMYAESSPADKPEGEKADTPLGALLKKGLAHFKKHPFNTPEVCFLEGIQFAFEADQPPAAPLGEGDESYWQIPVGKLLIENAMLKKQAAAHLKTIEILQEYLALGHGFNDDSDACQFAEQAKKAAMVAAAPPKNSGACRSGIELIAAERQRQIEVEGWTPDHDATHYRSEMAIAACCYADPRNASLSSKMPYGWPWDKKWWKPSTDSVKNLIKAGALIAAEIDRLSQDLPSSPSTSK